ncbi:MAG: SH3 domain-containing protein [Anaerolineae bacterium]|nr:SH3 domain-containing protein [Anaerolineae bacterium]
MKAIRLPVLLLLTLAVVATGCDSRALLGAALGGEGDAAAPPQPPAVVTATPVAQPPVVVTATPPGGVIVVTATPSGDATVNTAQLNLRSGPSQQFRVVTVLNLGDPLTVIGRSSYSNSAWFKVLTATRVEGWVAGWLVDLNIDISTVPVVATPVPPATSTPIPTPTPAGPQVNFWVDSDRIPPSTCTTIHWRTASIRELYFEGLGVTGNEDRTICPPATHTYVLRVVKLDGSVEERAITVYIGNDPSVNFRADRTQIGPSECTTIRWDVEGVQAVYFEGMGTVGHSTAYVCPGATKTYTLKVQRTDGGMQEYYVTIQVDSAYGP